MSSFSFVFASGSVFNLKNIQFITQINEGKNKAMHLSLLIPGW